MVVTLVILYAVGLGQPAQLPTAANPNAVSGAPSKRRGGDTWQLPPLPRFLGGSGATGSSDRPVPPGYVPISVGALDGTRTAVELCRLDVDAYRNEPWRFPMFRDWVQTCQGPKMTRTIDELSRAVSLRPAPAGFIFHESRVGSTLLCNMLAVDPDNVVYSESRPPAQLALHCAGCEEKMQVRPLFMRRGRDEAQNVAKERKGKVPRGSSQGDDEVRFVAEREREREGRKGGG